MIARAARRVATGGSARSATPATAAACRPPPPAPAPSRPPVSGWTSEGVGGRLPVAMPLPPRAVLALKLALACAICLAVGAGVVALVRRLAGG